MTADRAGAALQVRDIRVSYGPIQAVRGVSLTVPSGSLVTLIGANGAGKSSTLAAISGLVRARSGQILVDGEDVTRWRSHRLVAAGIVQVPEGREVLATLTIEENLQLGAWHQRRHIAEGLADVFERFPVLADRRRLPAGSLSGGEQQMLAIGRALLARPRILLMDEPSMGLAPMLVDEVFAVIERIRAEGTTVLLVEQNAHRALQAADHGYVLETGEVILEGPASQLLADERVVEAYLGEAFDEPVPDPAVSDGGGRCPG
ncbi:MAG: ABC transporter ATP-binding protein [Euzebyales bacterium]|nr:ABC transporter ATP-binding protein [Euzebyales bacterium]